MLVVLIDHEYAFGLGVPAERGIHANCLAKQISAEERISQGTVQHVNQALHREEKRKVSRLQLVES